MAEDSAARGADRPVGASNWNLPNALTALRICLVPLLGWLLLWDGGQDEAFRLWAGLVFFLAIATDRVDGDLARRRGSVTDVGKMLDPIADKALTGMAFVGLSIIGELWWWVTILVLGREALITMLRFWVIRFGVIPASRGGKVKTMLQGTALLGFILPFRQLGGWLHPVGLVFWWASVVVMAAAVAVTVATGVDYVGRALRVRRRGRRARRSST